MKVKILALLLTMLLAPSLSIGQEKSSIILYAPDELAPLAKLTLLLDPQSKREFGESYCEMVVSKVTQPGVFRVHFVVVSISDQNAPVRLFFSRPWSNDQKKMIRIYDVENGKKVTRVAVILFRVDTNEGSWQINEKNLEVFIQQIASHSGGEPFDLPAVEFSKN